MNPFSALLAHMVALFLLATSSVSFADDIQPITSSSYVTRAEAAMILLSSIGTRIPNVNNEGRFPDLVDDQWYTKYMITAVNNGMLSIRTNGLLQPHMPVTRAEFLKMITIAFNLEKNVSSAYIDIDQHAWYMPYIGTAYRYKLFRSSTDNTLQPNVLMNHYEVSFAIQTIVNTHSQIQKITLPPLRRSLTISKGSHTAAPAITHTIDTVIDIISNPPQEKIKFITAKLVKDAMVRAFQRNAVVSTSTKKKILDRVNTERQQEGLSPLQENPLLSAAAAQHAKDMWKRKFFNHTSPEGTTYVSRIRNTGYMTAQENQCQCIRYAHCSCTPVFAVGENIAQGQFTVDQVMTDWMNSKPHRRNIMSTEFDEIGIGLFGTNWVQVFGHITFYELPSV